MNFIYKKSILGGTFDHFHLGHQKLIDSAFESSEHVTIGITQPNMYQHKLLANLIEAYDLRKQNVQKYLEEKGFSDRGTLIPIVDIYGTTLDEKDIDAIFATEENLPNVKLINAKRKEIGFPELKVVEVAYVKDAQGKNITSERIRKGEIDKNGYVYESLFEKQVLTLSNDLRTTLQKPIGQVVEDTESVLKLLDETTIVIAVGDIIVGELKKANFIPAISIVDFKTRRHEIDNISGLEGFHAQNDAGTINTTAVSAYKKALQSYLESKTPQTIIINGEEDLLALPAILLAPLGSYVLYGQFDMGVVVNKVTKETKNNIVTLVNKFI